MEDYLKFLPIACVLVVYAFRMKEITTRRPIIKGVIKEKSTFRLFMVSGLIALLGSTVEYIHNDYHWSVQTLLLGMLCGLASFAIRRSAIVALGPYWSLHNELRETHKFVQTGPFRWMRHPTYFSMILELLCGVIVLNAPISAALTFLVFIPTLCYRIKSEEFLLIEKFGERYLTYKKKHLAILPTFPR